LAKSIDLGIPLDKRKETSGEIRVKSWLAQIHSENCEQLEIQVEKN